MDKYQFAQKKLMSPGPVPLPAYVKNSLRDYECHHRTDEFGEVLHRVFENLKKVFQTQQHCYLLASTGTGALEAAMVNCISTTDKILTINAGKFGERWGNIAKAFGIKYQEVVYPWGRDIDLSIIKNELDKDDYKALAFQACETSTGALLPVAELAKLCQEQGVLSIVDGVTALGAVDLPMDELGIDIMVAGSQKAFMLPTGMSFLCLSEKAERSTSDIPSFYFNLKAEKKSNLDGKTRWSTPTHFILALDLVLDHIVNEVGVKNHFKSIIERAEYFRKEVGLPLFPRNVESEFELFEAPVWKGGKKIADQVAESGIIIVAGQDQLADQVLRIGHMGEMDFEDLKRTADSIKSYL